MRNIVFEDQAKFFAKLAFVCAGLTFNIPGIIYTLLINERIFENIKEWFSSAISRKLLYLLSMIYYTIGLFIGFHITTTAIFYKSMRLNLVWAVPLQLVCVVGLYLFFTVQSIIDISYLESTSCKEEATPNGYKVYHGQSNYSAPPSQVPQAPVTNDACQPMQASGLKYPLIQ